MVIYAHNMNNTPKPSFHYLDELLKKSKIFLNQNQIENLWRFHKLLRENNKDHDLTRLIKFETIVTKHYVDCLSVPKFLKLKSPLLDIGTGAGFPGIPIKIFCPELEITLSEHRPRRVDFLKLVIKELGLKDIEIYPHKTIHGAKLKKFNSIVTRALETIPETLKRVRDLVEKDGTVIFMKGPNCSDEIREAVSTTSLIFKLENDIHYSISNQDKRRLVTFSRS